MGPRRPTNYSQGLVAIGGVDRRSPRPASMYLSISPLLSHPWAAQSLLPIATASDTPMIPRGRRVRTGRRGGLYSKWQTRAGDELAHVETMPSERWFAALYSASLSNLACRRCHPDDIYQGSANDRGACPCPDASPGPRRFAHLNSGSPHSVQWEPLGGGGVVVDIYRRWGYLQQQ